MRIKHYTELSYVIILIRNNGYEDVTDFKVNFGESWSEDYCLNRDRNHWIESFNRSHLGWMVLDKTLVEE